MSTWLCPDCGGSFPFPIKWQGHYACPWCHRELAPHANHPFHTMEIAAVEHGQHYFARGDA